MVVTYHYVKMGVQEYTEVHRWPSRLHRESTNLRFIPKGCEDLRVLIHLLSRIWSITMTTISAWSVHRY